MVFTTFLNIFTDTTPDKCHSATEINKSINSSLTARLGALTDIRLRNRLGDNTASYGQNRCQMIRQRQKRTNLVVFPSISGSGSMSEGERGEERAKRAPLLR